MSTNHAAAVIHPGRALGFLTLGSSLHNVITRLKAQPQTYPSLDLSFSASDPIQQPVILDLPENGIRLRFDGPDQRLRLVEVLDFSRISLTYKNTELVRRSRAQEEAAGKESNSKAGPLFKHIYNRQFGPSYPGEYLPPGEPGQRYGTYVLSYPGIAFSFPLLHSAYSGDLDFVALLSSSAASPTSSMAVFSGESWPETREHLYTKLPPFPRSPFLVGRCKEVVPDEVEVVRILGAGQLEVSRRTSPPFLLKLGETTAQDLVGELGPPDAIYRKSDHRISIHGSDPARQLDSSSAARDASSDTDRSSAHSLTDDSDEGAPRTKTAGMSLVTSECFYNYFHHGFDVLISYPSNSSPPFPGSSNDRGANVPSASTSELTVTKLILHANVPGSYPFNRHRRCRWTIHTDLEKSPDSTLTSEMPFSKLSERLGHVWHSTYTSREEETSMQRGMVLNRGWGESPESSVELLGGWEESNPTTIKVGDDSMQSLGNTELFGFPGLLFEVLKNDAVSCLTVY
ncbi:MAG: hypothetical protein Q9227_001265 [Pyrenula ochraceoflavens]